MKYFLSILLLPFFCFNSIFAQSYTSYFTGNAVDTLSSPIGGVCLMGGASEHDEAMKWFLNRANGGDILVLRASGSDGYNSYMYNGLGVAVNSVETIVFNNSTAANDSYVHQKIAQAEAIWFAGGDQWDYVSYWRNSPIDSLINAGLQHRHLVIGGTSAGMAIQGGFYFSAENGTITSNAALSNPYDTKATVDSTPFLYNNYLQNVITDTHYDNPDRKGRHVAFLARILTDYGVIGKGIACDEYTAVCIDTNGLAAVYGDFPSYDDNAYFIQPNCELLDFSPENCLAGMPLDWNRNQAALKVYAIKGDNLGSNTFDLNDWSTGFGGTWQHWHVNAGNFVETTGTAINCTPLSVTTIDEQALLQTFPNPVNDLLTLTLDATYDWVQISNLQGQIVYQQPLSSQKEQQLDLSLLAKGIYYVRVLNGHSSVASIIIKA